jgi:propanol-preferring alcohol dehydrogenase
VLLIGLGGVGMMGLAIARALFRARHRSSPISTRINATPRSPPAPPQAYDPSDPQARKRHHDLNRRRCSQSATSSVRTSSLQFATGMLARGGKVVVTGLARRRRIKAMTFTGTLTEAPSTWCGIAP